ncbi:MAG: hypothetical protein DDT30_00844 [Dehalococcoidia bacterium]|nr:hypothetical protein [Bacillota bacterium]MBT9143846.1 hypothetical protein [Bacillota bacterium]
MGGPGSGRKPKTLTRENMRRRLAGLCPLAEDVIEKTIKGEVRDELRVDTAWKIIYQIDGKPRQGIALEDSEPLIIRVIYESLEQTGDR